MLLTEVLKFFHFQQTTNSSTFAPISVFHVEEGSKYRFRVINAGLNVCPFLMQIEDHNFTIIATEVSYVKPVVIDSLFFLSGERYDFVIDTKNRPIRDYWIRFRQLDPCFQKLEGFAILRYHRDIKRAVKKNIEFNERVPPAFEQEFPNGTVCELKNLLQHFVNNFVAFLSASKLANAKEE